MHTFVRSHASRYFSRTHRNRSPSLPAPPPPHLSDSENSAPRLINLLWQCANVSMLRHWNYTSASFACVSTSVSLYSTPLWNLFPFFSLIPFKTEMGKLWQIYWSTLDLKAICCILGEKMMAVGCTHTVWSSAVSWNWDIFCTLSTCMCALCGMHTI